MNRNDHLPKRVIVVRVERQSPTVRILRLAPVPWRTEKRKRDDPLFHPGQFVMVGTLGYGEVPLGALSPPYVTDYVEVAVRRVGNVTAHLHTLAVGDSVTLRGPYGRGFPLDRFAGKDVVMVTGGCGIPPIAALVEHCVAERERFGRIVLLYGAKTPDELLLKKRMREWQRHGIEVLTTVDQPAPRWHGPVGFVPALVPNVRVNGAQAVAAVCGPTPMVKALAGALNGIGITNDRVFVSTERTMHCGIGKCQHCTIGDRYVCIDGPVFTLDELERCWDG